MGGFLKYPPTLVPVTSFLSPPPPASVHSQFLICPWEERLNQAMDISPCCSRVPETWSALVPFFLLVTN